MEFKISCSSKKQFEQFICDNYFQFANDFEIMCKATHYSNKLYTKSIHYECWDSGQLVGMLCAYLNFEKRFIYVPYLCISSQFQNMGIASGLLKKVLSIKDIDIFELEVRIQNKSAYDLYIKLGFEEVDRNSEKIKLRKEKDGK